MSQFFKQQHIDRYMATGQCPYCDGGPPSWTLVGNASIKDPVGLGGPAEATIEVECDHCGNRFLNVCTTTTIRTLGEE